MNFFYALTLNLMIILVTYILIIHYLFSLREWRKLLIAYFNHLTIHILFFSLKSCIPQIVNFFGFGFICIFIEMKMKYNIMGVSINNF